MAKVVDEDLFKVEDEVLQAALADLADQRFSKDEILPQYKALIEHYQKLLQVTKKVCRISDRQGQVLQRQQSELQNLLDNANQGFLTFDSNLKVNRQYSAECTRIFDQRIAGLSIVQLLSQGEASLEDKLTAILTQVFSDSDKAEYLQQLPRVISIAGKEIRIECKLIAQPESETEDMAVMMILTDITERLQAEAQIRFLSYHDKLTSLYNRAYVEAMLPELEQAEALPLSIIMVDMNGLKLINDVFGHQQGDLLLQSMARVLQNSCRQTDIIARWGGDEFVILLPNSDQENGRKIYERIQRACEQVSGCVIPLSAAAGMATRESNAVQLAELLAIAESRMYSDKLQKSKEVRKSIVENLEGLLVSRYFEINGHAERLQQLAFSFIDYVGIELTPMEKKLLFQLTTLHDIGKVAISPEILGSRRPLSASEWDMVKSHSEAGYRLAQSIGEPALGELILAIHERWDGEGYPCGLKGDQIPLLARVFAIVDVYDTITHDRPYKSAITQAAALAELTAGMESHFDPMLVHQFVNYMTKGQTF